MAERYETIGDIRGPGLFIGIDFVRNRKTRVPATEACREAWSYAMERGLITQFGGIGGNVLKFKPPLIVSMMDLNRMLDIIEDIAAFIQKKVDEEYKPNAHESHESTRI
jgi:4-aminobutyrate aminotransferase / (S)-3-amino-2-methylpropionate transaminase / 5-aminovalerate transaminase